MSDRKFMLMKNVFQARRHSRWFLHGCLCVWVCECVVWVCVGCHCVCVRGIFMTWPENEMGLCKKRQEPTQWECGNNVTATTITAATRTANTVTATTTTRTKTTVNFYSLRQQRTQPTVMPTTLPLKALPHSYLTHSLSLAHSTAPTSGASHRNTFAVTLKADSAAANVNFVARNVSHNDLEFDSPNSCWLLALSDILSGKWSKQREAEVRAVKQITASSKTSSKRC